MLFTLLDGGLLIVLLKSLFMSRTEIIFVAIFPIKSDCAIILHSIGKLFSWYFSKCVCICFFFNTHDFVCCKSQHTILSLSLFLDQFFYRNLSLWFCWGECKIITKLLVCWNTIKYKLDLNWLDIVNGRSAFSISDLSVWRNITK